MGQIPAWGLYRLLKAFEGRADDHRLVLKIPGGNLSFGLTSGRPYYVLTDILHLTFGAYLANAKLVPDESIASIEAASRASTGPACKALLDDNGGSVELARKLSESHVRSVLSVILPSTVNGWSLSDDQPCNNTCGCKGVDSEPELMRAVASHPNVDIMRTTVSRFLDNGPFYLASGGEALLTHAKTHIGDSRVLYLVRQGRFQEIDGSILADDDNVRILFGLTVAAVLTRDSVTEAAPRNAAGAENDLVVRELREAVQDLQSKNHYEVLGVSVDSRLSEVSEACTEMKRRFSRGRYDEFQSGEVGEHLDVIHARADQAFAILNDRDRRASYNRTLKNESPELNARLYRMFDAREVWLAGRKLLQANKVPEALIRFEEALSQDPDEPSYRVSVASALLAAPQGPDVLERAQTLLEEVLREHDKMVEAHLGMAQLYRLSRNHSKAMEHVRKALILEPDNEEGRRLKELLNAQAKPSKMSFQKKSESVVSRLKSRFKRGR